MAEAFLQKSFDSINLSDATASPSDILSGITAYSANGKIYGAMPNHGAVSANLNADNSYVIPAGYHNGAGVIRANSLASQTGATATAAQILSGFTAWANGQRLYGSYVPDLISLTKWCGINGITHQFTWDARPGINDYSAYSIYVVLMLVELNDNQKLVLDFSQYPNNVIPYVGGGPISLKTVQDNASSSTTFFVPITMKSNELVDTSGVPAYIKVIPYKTGSSKYPEYAVRFEIYDITQTQKVWGYDSSQHAPLLAFLA